MASFDLYTEQGRWRQYDLLVETALAIAGRDKEDFSTKCALDIGCGIGAGTRSLAKRFGKVVGVDADKSLLDRAKIANNYCPEGKKIKYDQAEDISTYDAFGEQFDVVFSAYTLAYLGDVSKVLRQWATLVKPGGLLIVLEIQGLFTAHHPLEKFRPWFETFDTVTLKTLGYNSNAGATMGDSAEVIVELKVLGMTDWQDAELSFNGPLQPGSPVWLGWEERWKRLWPLMSQSGNLEEGLHDAFFSCLSSAEHRCEKPAKLLVCTKISMALPSPKPKQADEEVPYRGEHEEAPIGSGGPGE